MRDRCCGHGGGVAKSLKSVAARFHSNPFLLLRRYALCYDCKVQCMAKRYSGSDEGQVLLKIAALDKGTIKLDLIDGKSAQVT